jgi:hypothetical protein
MLDPFWANLGPAAIVNDLVLGNIEAGSTLKILGCMGGVSLAPKIATLLAARGKLGVSVIASNDIVHATGQGIVSFPPHNPQPGGPMTDAYAARNRSSKDLGKQIVKWKKQLVPLQAQFAQLQENARLAIDGGADPDAVGAQLKLDRKPIWDKYYPILNAFVAAGGEHFDRVVGAFGAAHGGASHRTPQAQGWRKFVDNDTRQDLTAEDEHPDGRALPVVQQPPLQQPLAQQPQVVPHQGGAQQVPMIDATHNHPLMPGYVPDPVDASHNQPLM